MGCTYYWGEPNCGDSYARIVLSAHKQRAVLAKDVTNSKSMMSFGLTKSGLCLGWNVGDDGIFGGVTALS